MTNFNRAVYALNITVVQINVYVPSTGKMRLATLVPYVIK